MSNRVKLGRRFLDEWSEPYIIAEIGVNHEGSMDLALELIEQANRGGADAVKFQSYKASTLAAKNSPSYWDTKKESTTSQYALFKKYDSFSPEDYQQLAEFCNKIGIDFVSTPFDDDAIEFLDPLVPFYKIASADLTNVPFLRKIANKRKPVVLSTGASTLGEIDSAVNVLEMAGCDEIVLLHCILNYPTPDASAHLKMIKGLGRAFPRHLIGYSDHTLPDDSMTPLLTAHLLGAIVLEKHFTHDKTLEGNDHYHAMDETDLTRFVYLAKKTHKLLGPSDHKAPISSEDLSRKNARRSIVLAHDLKAGHKLSAEDLTYKRPAHGISPIHWDQVLNLSILEDLEADHILQWKNLTSEN